MDHVGKADLVHQIRLLTQQLYHERENNKVVVGKYRNELQEEMNKVIAMNKLIENMKKKSGSPRDNNSNMTNGPQSSIVVRTSPRSPPQSPGTRCKYIHITITMFNYTTLIMTSQTRSYLLDYPCIILIRLFV